MIMIIMIVMVIMILIIIELMKVEVNKWYKIYWNEI